MRIWLRPLDVISGDGAKRRKIWLIAACTLAPLPLGVSEPALAQCSGPLSNVPCTSGDYPSGISYSQTTANTDLHVPLESDVKVVLPGSGTAVSIDNAVGGSAVLSANGATINVTLDPAGVNIGGLVATASSGNATITASGKIDVLGVQGENALEAFVVGNGDPNAVASVTYNGPGLSSSGAFSTVIQANNLAANGNASIDASGNISGFFVPNGPGTQRFSGLFAEALGNGNASVIYRSGTISVQGDFANGIFAGADNDGSAEVTTLSGTTIIVSGANPGDSSPTQPVKPGIDSESDGGAAAHGKTVTATVASTIMMFGTATPDPNIFNDPVAIRALSFLDAPISVTYTGPGITTQGGDGIGILALSGGGGITVNSSWPITSNGSAGLGILAVTGDLLHLRDVALS